MDKSLEKICTSLDDLANSIIGATVEEENFYGVIWRELPSIK